MPKLERVVLGVTGSIAAYKAAELVRLLKRQGLQVRVLMTPTATRFISPLTLGTLAESQVLIELFPPHETGLEGSWTQHVHLGRWAQLIVVAPLTATTAAKLAWGMADSMLTATLLSARCPVLLCPAMDEDMYRHPATQANLERLRAYGYVIMEPEYGPLASGLEGWGRMPEPEAIVARMQELAEVNLRWQGRRVLVTAGPTVEPIDAVRFISNFSSGKMGFALAEQAARRGAEVVLITGPVYLPTPAGVRRIDVRTAEEMLRAVQAESEADVVIMSAAVADFAPAHPKPGKIKKAQHTGGLQLRLRPTPDILEWLGRHKRPGQLLVGFALETQNGEAYARDKLLRKNLDMIVLNNPHEPGAGFGHDTNRVTVFFTDGRTRILPLQPKRALAAELLDLIASELDS
ncbi:MAG: bifunctional phosphopantothenoylcysteine decarboxylase/phosphopantothenate--cysteine ligase CoaBC [Bacteroidetes bacterium]|nr:bifunctional phosphopantothenoylcysteine decarboxylase/phosphopantothenate--cysteine ligase CoaBC [Bacteroidota bacterium]MDW8137046.1 bifunctional phosphopantothenoylcysteine decarboxylase/phosphopantothenate--cysteine ligase CoaBC [Bacteroidota bacterium]